MKKMILTMMIAMLVIPAIDAKAENVEFEIGLVHYTNKTPFTLNGKAAQGADVSMRGKKVATIGDDGVFKIDLEVKEGDNVFHFKATKDGQSTTKGILVQMRTTPPKIHFYIDKAINSDSVIKTECVDLTEYVATGFTEPGCTVEADGKKTDLDGIMFSMKLSIEKAPSKTEHTIEVTDKYGNVSTSTIVITNVHAKVCKMQVFNKIAMIDSDEYDMPIEPTVYRGSTVVPVRFFCSSFLGGTVKYDAETRIITVIVGTEVLKVQINNPKATINGLEVKINGSAPALINGSLMVPFRFIGESFGCKVTYDAEFKVVTAIKNIYP
jgi:hypothetical protein